MSEASIASTFSWMLLTTKRKTNSKSYLKTHTPIKTLLLIHRYIAKSSHCQATLNLTQLYSLTDRVANPSSELESFRKEETLEIRVQLSPRGWLFFTLFSVFFVGLLQIQCVCVCKLLLQQQHDITTLIYHYHFIYRTILTATRLMIILCIHSICRNITLS